MTIVNSLVAHSRSSAAATNGIAEHRAERERMPPGTTIKVDDSTRNGWVARDRRVSISVDAGKEANASRPAAQVASAVSHMKSYGGLRIA